MARVESLPLLLKQLNLKTSAIRWKEQEDFAQKNNLRHSEYLANLAELEVNERFRLKQNRMVKNSKLPSGKTLATFDFSKVPSISKQHVMALATDTAWVKKCENIMFFGASGVGKTHLASAIAYSLIQEGVKCLFTQTTNLVQSLQKARHDLKLSDMLNKLSRYPVLILDDIGYVKKDEMETSVLFELIADRYETGSLIITANHPFSEWDKIFPDNMMAVAAIDRLVHHASVFKIEEESYRKSNAGSITNS